MAGAALLLAAFFPLFFFFFFFDFLLLPVVTLLADVLDFSSNGAPIEFGYYSYAEHNFTVMAMTGADNWQTQVQTVPEPSSLSIRSGTDCCGHA